MTIPTTARVGTLAPRFDLPCTRVPGFDRPRAVLDDYRGRWLVLMFYPRDFSMVCPTELSAMSTALEQFQDRECDVLGISTDSLETHESWTRVPALQGGMAGLRFPLASDEDGSVCQAYGTYVPRQHVALRGLYMIDPNGVLQYQVIHNLSVGRRVEEVLRVLDGLQTGGLCPADWSREHAPLDPTKSLRTGSVVGQYRIEKVLGEGTFGAVFRAYDLTLERTVALKVLKPGPTSSTEALLSEARAAAALNHPNICTIFAVDSSSGVPVIAMEFVDGAPLSKLLEAGPLQTPQAIDVVRQIALGMEAAHEKGIVHGDLKPANVMRTGEGQVRVMDFGQARRSPEPRNVDETMDWNSAESAVISGTPSYMSPEQARGEPLTAASDAFALGLIMYELASGRRAIAGKNIMDVMLRIGTLDARRIASELPSPLADLARQALELDFRQRSLGMREIAQRLQQH